ncbi:MAG: hypothetical protein LBG81_05285 [Coriobacteriaceae bacterium]|jgi:hypothetical protein|nr:hypothetical protein [Coriobacteriaceae bacterium]
MVDESNGQSPAAPFPVQSPGNPETSGNYGYQNPAAAPYPGQAPVAPAAYAQPAYAPAYYQPAQTLAAPQLTSLSGGMKFAWFLIGFLMGLTGLLLTWVINAGNLKQVRDDAMKFAVIGCVITMVIAVLTSIALYGFLAFFLQDLFVAIDQGYIFL